MSSRRLLWAMLAALLVVGVLPLGTAAAPDANAAFDAVWASTDQAVATQPTNYSWFWGPVVNDQRLEPYAQSPGGQRQVRYYDKSRMEINNPDGSPSSIYYVTNGLLTIELVTGYLKLGDAPQQVGQYGRSRQFVVGDAQNQPQRPELRHLRPLRHSRWADEPVD